MSEWQPAVMIEGHGKPVEDLPLWKMTARIKPIANLKEVSPEILRAHRRRGCKTDKFYEVHPDDAAKGGVAWETVIVCEHEILTDIATVQEANRAALDSARAEGEPPQGGPTPQEIYRAGKYAGEQAAPGLRELLHDFTLAAKDIELDNAFTVGDQKLNALRTCIHAAEKALGHEVFYQRAALTAPVPSRDETFICGECLHGVAQHEWESSAASSCLVEGCKCSGYKKAAPALAKDARPTHDEGLTFDPDDVRDAAPVKDAPPTGRCCDNGNFGEPHGCMKKDARPHVHTGQAVGWYSCDGKDCPICNDTSSPMLNTLRRCPKCKSADVIRGGHPDWEWECVACGEKFNDEQDRDSSEGQQPIQAIAGAHRPGHASPTDAGTRSTSKDDRSVPESPASKDAPTLRERQPDCTCGAGNDAYLGRHADACRLRQWATPKCPRSYPAPPESGTGLREQVIEAAKNLSAGLEFDGFMGHLTPALRIDWENLRDALKALAAAAPDTPSEGKPREDDLDALV